MNYPPPPKYGKQWKHYTAKHPPSKWANGALCTRLARTVHTFDTMPYQRPILCGIRGIAVVWYQVFRYQVFLIGDMA